MTNNDTDFNSFLHVRHLAILVLLLALLLASCTSNPCPEAGCGAIESETVSASQASAVTQKTAASKTLSEPEQGDKTTGEPSMQAKPDAVQAEAVGAIDFNGTAVTASVISTGCTLLEHFKVEHEIRDDACYLTLVRTKADFCRRAPFFIEVTIPWEAPAQCNGLGIEIVNPIIDTDKNTDKESMGRQLPKQ